MWEKVESRAHAPLKIFPFGPDASEVMLYGSVRYGLKAGGESCKDWAARAHLVKDGHGKVMMDFYQVYLVRRSVSADSHSWFEANEWIRTLPLQHRSASASRPA